MDRAVLEAAQLAAGVHCWRRGLLWHDDHDLCHAAHRWVPPRQRCARVVILVMFRYVLPIFRNVYDCTDGDGVRENAVDALVMIGNRPKLAALVFGYIISIAVCTFESYPEYSLLVTFP